MTRLMQMREAILAYQANGSVPPGPTITAEFMLDLVEHVLTLERRVSELSELAQGGNRK